MLTMRPNRNEDQAVKWTDSDVAYTAVLSTQSWLYNQFRYLCEMREIIQKEYPHYDGGIEGVFWVGGIALQNRRLGMDVVVGSKADSSRFERCLKALELPKMTSMPI